jgi:hypothetical protein
VETDYDCLTTLAFFLVAILASICRRGRDVAIEKGADLPEALASGEVGTIYRKACPIAISIEENSRRLVD